MIRRSFQRETEPTRGPVIDVLQRLWQTKLSSIALLEKWLSETGDTEIKAGITSQLIDERRHARLVGEQIRRLGGRIGHQMPKDAAYKVFEDAKAAADDLHRLFALYRGVKAYTLDRCGHLLPYVDSSLAQALVSLTQDEERHIRWADMRLRRLLTHERMRECNLLLGSVWSHLEAAWGRQWRHISFGPPGRRGA